MPLYENGIGMWRRATPSSVIPKSTLVKPERGDSQYGGLSGHSCHGLNRSPHASETQREPRRSKHTGRHRLQSNMSIIQRGIRDHAPLRLGQRYIVEFWRSRQLSLRKCVVAEMLFESLHLKNLLSFRDMEVPLRPLNVLIGPNATGKSNLIKALAVLKATPDDLAGFLRRNGPISDWIWKGDSVHHSVSNSAELVAVLHNPSGGTRLKNDSTTTSGSP